MRVEWIVLRFYDFCIVLVIYDYYWQKDLKKNKQGMVFHFLCCLKILVSLQVSFMFYLSCLRKVANLIEF